MPGKKILPVIIESINTEVIALSADDRLQICRQCEHFKEFLQRCGLCGCFMKFKTRLKSQHCPKNYW